ncbi:MAG: histidine-type phosphatase [Selenomonadaceae bacterium]|nr:histidine-type phosphatase [Selenomonadaceae bacterium]
MTKKIFALLWTAIFILSGLFGQGYAAEAPERPDYHLEAVLVLSRHNIRSPLVSSDSQLARLTPYKWYEWPVAPGQLSPKGGELETLMGEYFRQWMVKEGLIPEDYRPSEDEVRFYANSKQRTIATATRFAEGMFPQEKIAIEHKFAPEASDPVFSPRYPSVDTQFQLQALKEISQMWGAQGLQGIGKELAEPYATLEKVLQLKKSPAATEDGMNHFRTNDLEIKFQQGKQTKVEGSLELANSASDALLLQYYEEPTSIKRDFKRRPSRAEWEQIGRIKDICLAVQFSSPSVGLKVAQPLLKVMNEEILSDRKFSFLCGHDSNIATVLAALQVEDYELAKSFEKKAPLGVKLVIGQWRDKEGHGYGSLDLVYQSTDQLIKATPLTLARPPMIQHLRLKGAPPPNSRGHYHLYDVLIRFQRALETNKRG